MDLMYLSQRFCIVMTAVNRTCLMYQTVVYPAVWLWRCTERLRVLLVCFIPVNTSMLHSRMALALWRYCSLCPKPPQWPNDFFLEFEKW